MKKSRVPQRHEGHCAAPVRLVHIPALADSDGEPRVLLEVPPSPDGVSRRAVLMMFTTMAAALVAKRQLEAHR